MGLKSYHYFITITSEDDMTMHEVLKAKEETKQEQNRNQLTSEFDQTSREQNETIKDDNTDNKNMTI